MPRCTICFDLEVDEKGVFPPTGDDLFWAVLSDLERSAHSGCRSCRLLYDGIANCKPEFLTKEKVIVSQGRHWVYAERPRLYVRLRAENGALDTTLEFFSFKGKVLSFSVLRIFLVYLSI